MPKKDCDEIKGIIKESSIILIAKSMDNYSGKDINGVVFMGMLEESHFDGFGVSMSGEYILKDIKKVN